MDNTDNINGSEEAKESKGNKEVAEQKKASIYEKLSFIISFLALLLSVIALFTVTQINFSGDAKDIVNAINENTKATRNIIERNAIGIEFTDPVLEEFNSWNDPIITDWYNNPKKSNLNCGTLGDIGRSLGATIIVSNPPENVLIEVYITKKDYTEIQAGFWPTPTTKDIIPDMTMRSFDFVVCDKTPHQIVIVVRDSNKNILKHKSFSIK